MTVYFGSKVNDGYSWGRQPAKDPMSYMPYCAATVTTQLAGF